MLMQILYEVTGDTEAALTYQADKKLGDIVTDTSKWRLTIEAHCHEAHENGLMVGKVIARRKRRQTEDDDWGW